MQKAARHIRKAGAFFRATVLRSSPGFAKPQCKPAILAGFDSAAGHLRMLYISDFYYPRANGVSTSIRTFCRELRTLGHEVTVIAPEYPGAACADEGNLVRAASRSIPLDPEDRLMRGRALRELPTRRGSRSFDLVHVQTPFAAHYAGLRIARELGAPCVATYHTFFEEYLYHYVPFAPRALMRAFALEFSRREGNQLDALAVQSRAMLSALKAYGVRSPMSVSPTGIRLEEFAGGDGTVFLHLIRFHGVLAPNAGLRASIVPGTRPAIANERPPCRSGSDRIGS